MLLLYKAKAKLRNFKWPKHGESPTLIIREMIYNYFLFNIEILCTHSFDNSGNTNTKKYWDGSFRTFHRLNNVFYCPGIHDNYNFSIR